MIFHFSMSAAEPERVAKVIAELWDGEALPFPPVAEGSWMAMAGDDRNSAIEGYPAGTLLVPADGDADSLGIADPAATRHTATHAAIATPLSQAQVEAIGKREGWLTKYRKRGNNSGQRSPSYVHFILIFLRFPG